eukprot:TRINITY_DN62074_c0_g1_i1.p2 TRINITY_DN62074_c0_g1~~TRINITY_DN62074_c0_g1_i1.p2  ORF type:complete len:118 (-),score=34.62 TRINITY_DN62074_c0_g1_i1:58-411(-)
MERTSFAEELLKELATEVDVMKERVAALRTQAEHQQAESDEMMGELGARSEELEATICDELTEKIESTCMKLIDGVMDAVMSKAAGLVETKVDRFEKVLGTIGKRSEKTKSKRLEGC